MGRVAFELVVNSSPLKNTAAVAVDVDVDLFYSTYYESCLNGLRTVNIYILE